MVAFFNLPSELFSLLLTDWLGWEDVVKCDSAMCNRADRVGWLALLKNNCVFRSVIISGWNAQQIVRWLEPRCIRTKEVDLSNFIIYDKETMQNWFSETSMFTETVRIECIPESLWKRVDRFFNKLKRLDIIFPQPQYVACWNLIRNNPHLVELHVCDEPGMEDLDVPTDLSLPLLQKLRIDAHTLSNAESLALMELLPSVQCLSLSLLSQEYSFLAESCPHLLCLDVSNAFQPGQGDMQQIVDFLRWLKVGLRCLILPRNNRITDAVAQAILKHHAHSLQCLSFPGTAKRARAIVDNEEGTMEYHGPVLHIVDQLSTLHTLQLSYYDLLSVLLQPIVNPSITHLLIDFCGSSPSTLYNVLIDEFPSLTKLSVCRMKGIPLAVDSIVAVTAVRPLIDTVCVDNDELLAQLSVRLLKIKVGRYRAVDIFAQEY